MPSLLVGLATGLLCNCATPTPQLETQWVMDGFANPEGVAAAPDGSFFISNVSGGATEADGEGWISKISRDGEVIDARWTEGLNAPKGMVIHNGYLYVSDIDRVHVFNASTGKAKRSITVKGAGFLNDMTVFDGKVLVSDSANARIYDIKKKKASVWLEDAERLGGVNGLLADGDRLLISTMSSGSLYEAEKDKTLTEIANGMVDADGIGIVSGGYLVSAWRGEIYFVSSSGDVMSLANTREEGVFQNDLSVFDDLIIVPNWEPGTVTGWSLKKPSEQAGDE